MEVAPLDLASLNAKLNTALTRTPSASPSCSTRITPDDATATQFQQSQSIGDVNGCNGNSGVNHRKSLKYVGKRVIMVLRVKNRMPMDEKQEIIRLLLLKHMQRADLGGMAAGDKKPADASVQTKSMLKHKISGLMLSLPPDN